MTLKTKMWVFFVSLALALAAAEVVWADVGRYVP
jgi:hypothetical protein